jgi:hypothetical protein
VRSQFFSFLPTYDHCSSNATARVAGGKAQQLVVQLPGVVAGPQGVADHGVFIDADQAAGLSDAAALLEVGEDVEDLSVGEAGVEERGALALGEAVLAGAAGEQAALLVRAVAEGDAEVVAAAAAVVGALGVLAAEAAQVVAHGSSRE